MSKRVVALLYPSILILLILFVAFRNYSNNTWLLGWDNLVPEFNFWLNLKRSLFTFWQEYQGLGLLGGMAHAADLPHQITLLILDLFLPQNLLRYSWHLAMLLIGPLGVYFLIKYLAKKNFGAFLGSSFYLLNLATVQTFYVPFESFVSFFGLFPWLLFSALKYLKQGGKRNLLLFLGISLFSSPAFYVQTLFIVYLIILGIFVLEYLISQKKKSLPRVLKLLIVTFAVSIYWLLPTLYFSLTNSAVLGSTKINSIATPETLLMNQGFADFKNIALLKGFWLEYIDLQGSKFGYLMPVWHEWVEKSHFQIIGGVLFAISLTGLFLQIFHKKSTWKFSGILILALSILMLSGGRGLLGIPYKLLSSVVPLFGQMFRSPFTKWSVVTAFSYALGLGFFAAYLEDILKKKLKFIAILFSFVLVGLMVWQVKPIFNGELISRNMRVHFPSAYLDLFNFFQNQPKEARIARFPVQTFWGWDFYSWNYRGSGFLWYGIDQPILDRAFDVWSDLNETYYWQISTALYQKDVTTFKSTLEKYNVSYALIDKSVIVPEAKDNSILRFDDTQKLLTDIGATLVIQRDFLEVYKLPIAHENFVYAPNQLTKLKEEDITYSRVDPIYQQNKPYASVGEGLIYPFANLAKEEVTGVSYWTDFNGINYVSLEKSFKKAINGNYVLDIPPLAKNFPYIAVANVRYEDKRVEIQFKQPLSIDVDDKSLETKDFLPTLFVETNKKYDKVFVSLGGSILEIRQGRQVSGEITLPTDKPLEVLVFEGDSSFDIVLSETFKREKFNTCWQREGKDGSFDLEKSEDFLTIRTKDVVACSAYKIGSFNIQTLLKVTLPFRSDTGAKPHFCVVEEGKDECLNKDVFYHTATSKDWDEVERELILEKGKTYWLVLSARPPESPGSEWEISYKAPSLRSYGLVGSFNFSSFVGASFTTGRKIEIDGSLSKLKISLPTQVRSFDFGKVGLVDPKNCDLFKRGNASKEVASSSIIYNAVSYAASCDYSILTDISNQQDWLLRFIGGNVKGRSLKFYLFNQASMRNDFETLLPGGKFDASYGILAWPNVFNSEYVLNVETRSFGDEVSENELNPVLAYPVPLTWLQEFRLEPKDGQSEVQNSLKIASIRRLVPSLYLVKVKAGSSDNYLVLGQGFDSGWLGVSSKGKILKHFKLNSWENAWNVPLDINNQPSAIYIFYWPQILEFIGFAVLFLTLFLVLI